MGLRQPGGRRCGTDDDIAAQSRPGWRRCRRLPCEQTKDLIKNGRQDVPGRIAEELVLFRDRLRSPEAAEAFQAFVEKRKPDFSKFA